jgi:hypothetical protein
MKERFILNNSDMGENERVSDELGAELCGLHDSTLYDQDEDRSGERVDLATGVPIDNSTEVPGTAAIHSEFEHGGGTDALPSEAGFEDDAAARWLRENDLG